MADLRTDYKGHGSMKAFTKDSVDLFTAHNNGRVDMPSGYGGETPMLGIKDGALVLDMKDAQVFSPSNVKWVLLDGAIENASDPSTATASVEYDFATVSVVAGVLTIKVQATGL